ncbi:MAG: DUF1080 domain-containing protein [Proteobacteria bacterium]|nr:DUF1080 domain-containing protein [Pseudomonadota bacterium]
MTNRVHCPPTFLAVASVVAWLAGCDGTNRAPGSPVAGQPVAGGGQVPTAGTGTQPPTPPGCSSNGDCTAGMICHGQRKLCEQPCAGAPCLNQAAVCGQDGVTYQCQEEAWCRGTVVMHPGSCATGAAGMGATAGAGSVSGMGGVAGMGSTAGMGGASGMGAPTPTCSMVFPPSNCVKFCPHGFVRGPMGCILCECASLCAQPCAPGQICNPGTHQCQLPCGTVPCPQPDMVCGRDGKTYWCGRTHAECNGVIVSHGGECPGDPAPSCFDGQVNGFETSKDCGGPWCEVCDHGQGCKAPTDCRSGLCAGALCQAPAHCSDGVLSPGELLPDCGGPCLACLGGSFVDGFDAPTASGWSTWDGTWTVTPTGQYSVDNGPARKSLVADRKFADFTLQATVTITVGGVAGVLYRVSRPGPGQNNLSGYFFFLNLGNQIAALGRHNRGWTDVASAPAIVVAGQPHRLRAVVTGARHQLYVDDVLVLDQVDATFPEPGLIGVRADRAAAFWDDVSVR